MLFLRLCTRCEALLRVTALTEVQALSRSVIAVSKENDVILKKLGFLEHDYNKVLPKQRTIRELNLQRVVNMLNRLGFTTEEIQERPNILWLHPFLIDHRFKLLEESGIERKKITLEWISKFPRLTNSLIDNLKKSSFINQETDVIHSILSFSDIPSELYPTKTDEEQCFGDAQTTALQIYISWKLGLSKEEVESKYESYEHMRHKSIRLVKQNYDILINSLGMPENKIKQNVFLLHSHPDNFLDILKHIPKIGDSTIQYVASTNPKVLMRPVYKMLKVLEILKKYDISDESIAWYSNILTLSPETVRERAAALYDDPVFRPFFCSPRICFVICRYHTTISRSRLLTQMKWRCQSLNILTTFHQDFQKRINLGHDESRGVDVVHYLKKHLGYENKEIRKQLKLHPFFYLIPLTVVDETLQLLLGYGIGKSKIFEALPIVLYPKEKVARWLKHVHTQSEVQPLRDEEGRLSSSLVLHIVLYYMERPYHFSGHGVWSKQDISDLPYMH